MPNVSRAKATVFSLSSGEVLLATNDAALPPAPMILGDAGSAVLAEVGQYNAYAQRCEFLADNLANARTTASDRSNLTFERHESCLP
jgi:hypothetical protein